MDRILELAIFCLVLYFFLLYAAVREPIKAAVAVVAVLLFYLWLLNGPIRVRGVSGGGPGRFYSPHSYFEGGLAIGMTGRPLLPPKRYFRDYTPPAGGMMAPIS